MIFAAYIGIFMLIPLVGFDVIYQLYTHLKKLRMTRQEVKDEFKQQEGDPIHYAIALQYDNQKMQAPKVLAIRCRLNYIKY